ncbi:MAG: HAD family hydrolase [Armatimonadota bacterium]
MISSDMTPRYRHIIWDWNGTLFDDAWLCIEIINDLLARRGMPTVDSASYEAQFTFPVKDYYRSVGFDFTQIPFEQLAAEFMEQYDRRRFECRLQPGARQVLDALTARGCRQSILSAYEQSRLDEMVAFMGLQEVFTHLYGLNDYYSASKLDLGKRFLSELESLDAAVLIGDSLHDAEVAEAMGIDCVLIPCGHFSRLRLSTNGNRVLDSLQDVLQLA